MADHSSIEWTEATWNPVVGCTAVSPGCDRCYAARDASVRVMAAARQHIFQLLTKRHGRMRSLLHSPAFDAPVQAPNVWLGVSVEDQRWADIRIPALLDTPAAVRWLSCEPPLGPIDLTFCNGISAIDRDWAGGPSGGTGAPHPLVDWVVVGGESGPGARPMHPDWARSLRDQCAEAGVPFFFKQAGEDLARQWRCRDRKGHDPADWPEPFPRDYPAEVRV